MIGSRTQMQATSWLKAVKYSDRWFAKKSGTDPRNGGNSPHAVAEWLRKNGDVLDAEWPTDKCNSIDEFYAEPDSRLSGVASRLIAELDIKHEFVPNNAKALYDALQYSPLGFSVHAWVKDAQGLYYRPAGSIDTHWVVSASSCLVGSEKFATV